MNDAFQYPVRKALPSRGLSILTTLFLLFVMVYILWLKKLFKNLTLYYEAAKIFIFLAKKNFTNYNTKV